MSARETSLAHVVSELIPLPDLWADFTDHYLRALDRLAKGGRGNRHGHDRVRERRPEDLSEWHSLLVERLAGSGYEERLDLLVVHPALAGPEQVFLGARLAHVRSDPETACRLVSSA